jgi:hypothetical protein
VGELDTILITHGHFDHFLDVLPLQGQTGATTVSNIEIFAYLQSQGVENAMPIQKGGTSEVGGIKVTATHAFHSSSIALDDGSLIYGGEPVGYVIEFESGFKLYHAGDTCIFGDMQLIVELYRPDLALLPISNQVTTSLYEAAHAARLLGVMLAAIPKEGFAYSLLRAYRSILYERHGWVPIADEVVRAELPPFDPASVAIEPFDDHNLPKVMRLCEQTNAERTGPTIRSPEYWQRQLEWLEED